MWSTHISYVFFVGDRAYKLKKPVDLGFLDFTSREARLEDCRREVELNRRFAPDVYLGIADVIGPDDRPCDHLVVMRRLPAERRLSTLLRSHADVSDGLRSLAHLVAAFHSRAETSPEISGFATSYAVLGNWEQSFDQLSPFGSFLDTDVASAVERLARRYLAGRQELFARRIAEGKVRDGHGDLQPEDIFLMLDGPRVLDCLEFADRYRYADVISDAAFLVMHLERLDEPDLAERFLHRYLEATGDNPPRSLIDHYIAYRAHVRAKVAAIRRSSGDVASEAEANDLLRLALSRLRKARVRLVMVGGAPASGKTTLAGRLSSDLGLSLIGTDEVRKDLAGLPHTRQPTAFGTGHMRPRTSTAPTARCSTGPGACCGSVSRWCWTRPGEHSAGGGRLRDWLRR